MNTKQTTREQISALADGELRDSQLDLALAALRDTDAKADWELYHRIGDALRSEEVADVSISEGFSARLAARLEAEPTIIAPAGLPVSRDAAQNKVRRWALPGFAAAAAMAGVAFFTTPQLMVALQGEPAVSASESVVAEVGPAVAPVPEANAVAAGGEVVLRDAHIDDYLLAHQRFSPSVYSSAQYARSAALATEPRK